MINDYGANGGTRIRRGNRRAHPSAAFSTINPKLIFYNVFKICNVHRDALRELNLYLGFCLRSHN
jgi:hypothetical protein